MIKHYIILSTLFTIASFTLHASEQQIVPTTKTIDTHRDKQALIEKIILYNSFNSLLNIANDDLSVVAQRIKEGRIKSSEWLTNYLTFCKDSESPPNEKTSNSAIMALYCLSWSKEEIKEMKTLGKKLVLLTHPDQNKHINSKSIISTEIKDYLINNLCGSSLNDLLSEKKQLICNIQETIIANNYYKIIKNNLLSAAANQIGYDIGTKFVNKIIPTTDKRDEYILSQNFLTKSEINRLNLQSELNKYPQQLRSRTNHEA